MKLGLFASNTVGLEIAKFLFKQEEQLLILGVDAFGDAEINDKIIQMSNIEGDAIYTSEDLKKRSVADHIKKLEPDIIILAWWPYIIKGQLLDIPQMGWLNFHPAYLPYCRGKDPNFWAIRNGESYGVTLHFIDQRIDNGDIAFQKRIDISWEDTGKSIYEKALTEIVNLFKDNYTRIKAGDIPHTPQDPNKATFYTRAEIEAASQIDLDSNYRTSDLLNLIRARTFPPHPAAWFEVEGTRYEVRVEITKVN